MAERLKNLVKGVLIIVAIIVVTNVARFCFAEIRYELATNKMTDSEKHIYGIIYNAIKQ